MQKGRNFGISMRMGPTVLSPHHVASGMRVLFMQFTVMYRDMYIYIYITYVATLRNP